MKARLFLNLYTPAEAGRISGLSPGMQRDWRRRGFLPAADGHARFNAFEVSDMRCLKLLSDGGLGPGRGVRSWKQAVAFCIVSRALVSPLAYSSIPKDLIVSRKIIIEKYISEIDSKNDNSSLSSYSNMILDAPHFAVWWGELSGFAGNSLDDINSDSIDQGISVLPGIFIDVHRAADELIRLARPLVNVQF
jgi:hypothetical protein